MRINKINETCFGAGNVYINGFEKKALSNFEKLQKIAKKEKVDITISKYKEDFLLPYDYMYLIHVQKEVPVKDSLIMNKFPVMTTGCAVVKKKSGAKKMTENIIDGINATLDALDKKIQDFIK